MRKLLLSLLLVPVAALAADQPGRSLPAGTPAPPAHPKTGADCDAYEARVRLFVKQKGTFEEAQYSNAKTRLADAGCAVPPPDGLKTYKAPAGEPQACPSLLRGYLAAAAERDQWDADSGDLPNTAFMACLRNLPSGGGASTQSDCGKLLQLYQSAGKGVAASCATIAVNILNPGMAMADAEVCAAQKKVQNDLKARMRSLSCSNAP
jgi:hypothetical protein